MAKLGAHYIHVTSEDNDFPVDITTQPVEKGNDVTDHVQPKPRTLSISGSVVENAAKIQQFIVKAKDSGQIVKFTGRTTFTGLISGFQPKRTYKNASGFEFTLTMTEVKIAQSSYVEDLPVPVKAQKAKIVNSGTKQTKTSKKSAAKSTTTKKKASTKKEKVQKVKFKPGSPWA